MGDLPALGRQQTQNLEAIAGQIEAGNARLAQVSDNVGEIPKVARAQTEAINGIRKQLEMSGEQNLVTSQTMEKLSTAIAALGEVNTTQLEALNQMNRRGDDQTAQLSSLIARQGRRFVMLFVVTVILAMGAIAAAIIAMVK
jgi:septal ring factor EnvC (AmiA/AmiB activator)